MSRRTTRLEPERDRSRSPIDERRSLSPSLSGEEGPKLTSARIVIRGLPKEFDWIKVKELFLREVGFSGFLEFVDDGCAVMVFKSVPGAMKAINVMNGFKLDDEILQVSEENEMDRDEFKGKAHRRPDRYDARKSGGMMHPNKNHEDFQGQARGRFQKFFNPGMDSSRYMTPEVLEYLGIDGPLTNQVFVSHLDYSINWQKLKDVFRLAGNVLNAEVKENPDGSPRGLAIITYEHSYEAVQAVAMFNDQVLHGRVMRVRMDRDPHSGNSSASFYAYRRNERRENVGIPPNGRLPGGLEDVGKSLKDIYRSISGSNYRDRDRDRGTYRNGGNRYNHDRNNYYTHGGGDFRRYEPEMSSGSRYRGRHNHRYESSYNDYVDDGYKNHASSRCVMIKNLPLDFSWRELKQFASEAGNVRFVDILLTSSQRSTGIGTVRFVSCADADRAVRKLDGVQLEGRQVRVELDYQ